MFSFWVLVIVLKTASGVSIDHVSIGEKVACEAAADRVASIGGITATCVMSSHNGRS